ncbi:hypothetical protein NQ318_020117 [Aromia moschata]|uniref:NADH dehydrogenase subunit 6 n=1 Tax=Aromia moschata TaxID=1265417 RepID=A0AAV8Z9U1_9CUCU|nr:hypothetical protein NQ318_020117 [Aromia moschata]
MLASFCFCYKHRSAAILMAVSSLIAGILGTISFGVKVHFKAQRSDEDYLIFSVFHLLISVVLISALIWEKPILIFVYLVLHIAVLTAFLTHTIIYVPIGKLFICYIAVLCILLYFMYCIYLYYVQMKMKQKSRVNERYVDAVYYINNNTIY